MQKSEKGVKAMTVKEYLTQARDLIQEINTKQDTLEHWRSLSEKSTMSYQERVKGIVDKRYDIVVDSINLEREIADDKTRLQSLVVDIERAFNALSNSRYSDILRKRYLFGMRWEDIAEVLYLDIRWLHRLHGWALQSLEPYVYDKLHPEGMP